MRPFLPTRKISLTLILFGLLIYPLCTAQIHGLGRARHALTVRDNHFGLGAAITAITVPHSELSILPILPKDALRCTGTTCVTATPTPSETTCDSAQNEFSNVDGADGFRVICNVDFHGQDIYPFILAGSFKQCLTSCQDHNEDHNDTKCAGFVYAPDRANGADDCYLKSSLNEPIVASIRLIGATMTATTTVSSSAASALATSLPSVSPDAPVAAPESADETASVGNLGIVAVKETKQIGSSSNKPTKQYVSHPLVQPLKLASHMTVPGVNLDLLRDYSVAADTGVWNANNFVLEATLADMKTTPHLSRDGGKGGIINGTNIFIFCDTGVYSDGEFVAFVSSSVATDQSMNALEDKPIELVDHIGEWQDDVGRMRGFAPMTEGEEAYNKAVSGDGYRYAVWPESSPICLNASISLIYASLVYDTVDMNNIEDYNLTYFGNTLLETKVDPKFGPYADRIVPYLFKENEIPFGSLAGFRAWGKSGYGNMDGEIMLFGKSPDHNIPGVFAAKTYPENFTDLGSYVYWNGREWSSDRTGPEDASAMFLNIPVIDLEIIYMPKSRTFMMIYTVFPPDNTFYYRQLYPYSDHKRGVHPPYEQYGDEQWGDTIVTGEWEEDQHVLYKVPDPAVGRMYAGGVHAGYYGNEDITNGGDSILLTWTEHTGKEGESPESGYAHKAARARISYE